MPLGAVVLLSDGADNSGGIDLDTISQIRRRQIPVHTIGFGREKLDKDIEIVDAALPAHTLADSRLSALVTFRQYGYAGQKAVVSVRDGGKVLASRQVQLKGDGAPQSEPLLFNAGLAGPKTLEISIDPLPGEQNRDNNSIRRLIDVETRKPRILYMEGEPRWEFKFIRRAVEDDRSLQLASILRTTQNKIYVQGNSDPHELEQGFPAKPEELFVYDGLIIGSVETSYFTQTQQDLIREFANRRGGGILFLGGRFALAEGGYLHSPLAELVPVRIPENKGTFHRDFSNQQLTAQGRDSLICRLVEDPARNAERWDKMPQLANYNDVGEAKPGAVTLMEVVPAGRRAMPLLVTENYGRGRTAVFATSGSWRWRMWQDHTDTTHATFWQQLLRYLVSDSPGRVTGSTPRPVLSDETKVTLRAEVRDKAFEPVPNAVVEAHITGPDGTATSIEMIAAADRARRLYGRVECGNAGFLRGRNRGGARQGGTGPRHGCVPPRRWRGGKFSHGAEPRAAGKAGRADRRALLHGSQRRPAAGRDFLFRSRHHYARNQRSVGHARSVPAGAVVARLGVGAAPQVGGGMKALVLLLAAAFLMQPGTYAATYYLTVSGLGGEPDYEQRFGMWAADIGKILKASSGRKG